MPTKPYHISGQCLNHNQPNLVATEPILQNIVVQVIMQFAVPLAEFQFVNKRGIVENIETIEDIVIKLSLEIQETFWAIIKASVMSAWLRKGSFPSPWGA